MQRRSDYLRYQRAKGKRRRNTWWFLAAAPLLCLLLYLFYLIPPVHDQLSGRVGEMRTRIVYFFKPPDKAIFLPGEQAELSLIVQQTIAAATADAAASATITSAAQNPAASLLPQATSTITPTPLPQRVELEGVKYVDQHGRWNYCGPANLAMALNYWGWKGTRDDIARVVKPGVPDISDFIQAGKPDKNVMPYEMTDFVNENTEFRAVLRIGGENDLVKSLIASGFPVVIEKGYYEADYTGKIAWLGHYLFITGYDEGAGYFIVQDAYLQPGKDLKSDYQTFTEGWRSFNYTFFVVYPPQRENEVLAILGPWSDVDWARSHALDLANQEMQHLSGIDEFFAWFNKGSSHVALAEYNDAAFAYDYAFILYSKLGGGDTQRPYRIMWYQTGPYWAYYYTGRYQDVINLANTTLNDTISEPTLEESLYWRGMAYLALGQTGDAVSDFQQAVYINPNFQAGLSMLAQLGVSP